MAVDRPLALEFPDCIQRSFMDDLMMQLEVRCTADVEKLAKWQWRLAELVSGRNRPLYKDDDGTYDIALDPLVRSTIPSSKCFSTRALWAPSMTQRRTSIAPHTRRTQMNMAKCSEHTRRWYW